MFDDLDHLRQNAALLELLGRYVEVCQGDCERWQDRVMQLDRHEARELSKLHGVLLGFGWIEQNTGHTPTLRPDAAPACYRVTAAGAKAFREVQGLSAAGFDASRPFPKKTRRKNKKRTQRA